MAKKFEKLKYRSTGFHSKHFPGSCSKVSMKIQISCSIFFSINRRMSMDTPSWGVSPARLDRASFNHIYRGAAGQQGVCDKDITCCVICLAEFIPGNSVRRLACLHLFHTSCVDAWLINNRYLFASQYFYLKAFSVAQEG